MTPKFEVVIPRVKISSARPITAEVNEKNKKKITSKLTTRKYLEELKAILRSKRECPRERFS